MAGDLGPHRRSCGYPAATAQAPASRAAPERGFPLADTRSLCQLEAMTIRLLPGDGVELPWAEQPLRFGMTLDEVQSIVKPYADLHDTFVCNSAWAKKFTCDDLELLVFAGESDALLGVSATRSRDRDAVHVPVGLDDIDLFGWPVDEVVDALENAGRDVRRNEQGASVDRVLDLSWATPPTPAVGEGRASGYVPPAPSPFIDRLCLYAPDRSEHDG
jgi:hypothetical protein